MNKNQEIVCRNIHGTYFLIDLEQNYFDEKCYIYELNSMGYFIWNNIDKFDSVEQFVLHLQSVIADQIPFEILLEDVNAFIICLADEGFVKLEDNDGRNK